MIIGTPLMDMLFDGLANDEIYEEASRAICDLIHETQEVEENLAVIEQIVPRLVALQPQLAAHADDGERMRAYSRIFSEAGEWYVPLVLAHQTDFMPIVQALAQCAACEEFSTLR